MRVPRWYAGNRARFLAGGSAAIGYPNQGKFALYWGVFACEQLVEEHYNLLAWRVNQMVEVEPLTIVDLRFPSEEDPYGSNFQQSIPAGSFAPDFCAPMSSSAPAMPDANNFTGSGSFAS